jgi:hypothetical protein
MNRHKNPRNQAIHRTKPLKWKGEPIPKLVTPTLFLVTPAGLGVDSREVEKPTYNPTTFPRTAVAFEDKDDKGEGAQ